MADVIITPASGLIDFQNTSGISSATIQLDGNGNLALSAAGGDIQIGDTSADIFIGDGINNVDLIFEEDGEIRGLTGKTITLGQSDSFISFAGDITGNVDFTGTLTAGQNGKIVFPDNTTVPDSPTNQQHDYITFGANGSISQVSGRGALLFTSSDDSMVIANGDVGRAFTNSNINVGDESIFLLADNALYVKTDLQEGWGTEHTLLFNNTGVLSVNGNTVWHAGNDGSGSGLDADTVDGIQSGSFLRSDLGGQQAQSYLTINDAGNFSVLEFEDSSNVQRAHVYHANASSYAGIAVFDSSGANRKDLLLYQNGTITWNNNTVWHAANDGSGSGLDADLLDGINSGSFLRSDTAAAYSGGILTVQSHGQLGSYQGWGLYYSSGWKHTNANSWGYYFRNEGGGLKISVAREAGTANGAATTNDYFFDSTTDESIRINHTNSQQAYSGQHNINAPFYNTFSQTGSQYQAIIKGRSTGSGQTFIGSLGILHYASGAHNLTLHSILSDGTGSSAYTFSGSSGTVWTSGNDGSGSGLDADTVDGIQGASFLRSDANDTLSAIITGHASNTEVLRIRSSSYSTKYIYYGGWSSANSNDISRIRSSGNLHIDSPANGHLYFNWYASNRTIYLGNTGQTVRAAGSNIVWHGGNDGAGSGLDADLLDGISSASFLRSDIADTYTRLNTVSSTNNARFQTSSSWGTRHQTDNGYIDLGPANTSWAHIYTDRPAFYFNADLYVNNNKVWHAGNDGSGSGLDADLLDGSHKSAFVCDRGQGQIGPATSWDLTEPGMYGVTSSTTYTGTNNPESAIPGIYRYGVLTVFEANGNGLCQLYTPHTGNKIALRTGWNNGGWYPWQQVWTSTSDGAGSGLDADTVDGIQADRIPYGSGNLGTTANTNPGQNLRSGFYDVTGTANGAPTNTWYSYINIRHTNTSNGWGHQIAGSFYDNGELYNRHYDSGNYAGWTKIWNAANDGAGSGLDADNLDGYTWASSGKQVRASDFYADNWFRNYNAGEGLYNEATGCHFVSDGTDQWTVRDGGNSIRIEFKTNGTTRRASLYADNASSIGFLNAANQWGLRYYSNDGTSPNLYFLEEGNETWSGNPPNDQGKIEYHSNRFYIAAGANSTEVCVFRRSGSDVVRISNGGTITASGDVTAFSDINLKKNIEVIPNALDKVSQIRGVTFDRIDLEDESRQSGVIAQEVEKVLPEVVRTAQDGTKTVAYGNMVGLLIEAIKEQQKQIDDLKAKLEEGN